MKVNTKRKCAVEFLVIGSGLLLLCLIMIFVFPGLYHRQLSKRLALVEGSTSYPIWRDIPLPIYLRLYFFNITNGEDFLKHGAKLKVEQLGPYTYKCKWIKDPIAWNPNGTVSYKEIRTCQFVPEKSSGSEDDVINTLNGPMITIANVLKNVFLPIKIVASFILGLENEKIIIQRTIKELAFGGYEDPLIKYAAFILPNLPYKDGLFSWLYGKNGTDDGMFTVYTGQRDIRLLNVIDNWNGARRLNFWKGNTCNMINGSSGEMSPPVKDTQKDFTFFQSIFCRSLTFSYTGENTDMGVKSRRFVVTDKVFANGTDNPDNYCFQTSEYMPSGVQDISTCQYGSPVFLSFPHFYLADPVYLDFIDGLKPQEEKHSSYIDVEPTTGLSIYLKLRFQINVKLEKNRGLLQFQNVPEGIFPVLWAEIDASLTSDLARYLKNQLDKPKIIFYSLVGVVMAISAIMIIASVIVLVRMPRNVQEDDEDDQLLDPGDQKNRNGKSCSRKSESDGATGNCSGCFGDSAMMSSTDKENMTGSGTFENDAKLLDAGSPEKLYNLHKRHYQGGEQ